jgi:anti-sigma regulatory factor (Ser/Thr protein kinase)
MAKATHNADTRAWTGGWTGERFGHEAFVFSDDQAVRERVVPFVEEGLALGEPVMVVADDTVRDVLTQHLDSRIAELALFAPSGSFWQGGHATLAAYHASMQPLLASGRPWRIVGEPSWLAQRGGPAWSRFEAVANEAFADYPYYSLCLHDRRRLPADVVDAQLRAHPMVWDGAKPAPSPDYEPTDAFLRAMEPSSSPPGHEVRRLVVDDLSDGGDAVADWMDLHPVRSRSGSARLAVHEVVVNAIQAAGRAQVSEWHQDDHVVWEIRDEGPGLHDQTAGYMLPVHDPLSGRGLWVARSLADDSSLCADGRGTTIRLMFRADPAS